MNNLYDCNKIIKKIFSYYRTNYVLLKNTFYKTLNYSHQQQFRRIELCTDLMLTPRNEIQDPSFLPTNSP